MTTQETNTLTEEQVKLVKDSEDVRYEIAKELNLKVQTIYSWAHRNPEKLANSRAAMRVINKHLKATA